MVLVDPNHMLSKNRFSTGENVNSDKIGLLASSEVYALFGSVLRPLSAIPAILLCLAIFVEVFDLLSKNLVAKMDKIELSESFQAFGCSWFCIEVSLWYWVACPA